MADSIRIVAKMKDGEARVKVLINHPMETGLRKDKASGKMIPAHFIQHVSITHNDDVVLQSNFGVAVSKNPYIGCRVKGANSGDSMKVEWTDNQGNSDSKEANIKG